MAENRNSGGVECARCAIAAVTMSPPQVSSMVMAMPSATHRSRICRALVRPPTLEILRLIDVHRAVLVAAQHGRQRVDHLVEDEGPLRALADRAALLVAHAGLLDIDVDVLDGVDHAGRLVHQPAGVGVGDQHVALLQLARGGADALDVDIWIAADLELELGVALGAILVHALGHILRALLRDRAIEQEVLAIASAEQSAPPAGRSPCPGCPSRRRRCRI